MADHHSPRLSELQKIIEKSDLEPEFSGVLKVMSIADEFFEETRSRFNAISVERGNTQLRFAGYHVLRATLTVNEAERKLQIDQAYEHCEKATIEIIKVQLRYYINKFEEIEKSYKRVQIHKVTGNIRDWRKSIEKAKLILKKDLSVKEYQDQYLDLIRVFEDFEDYKKTLDKALIFRRLFLLQYWLAIIALFCTIAAFLLKDVYHEFFPNEDQKQSETPLNSSKQ